eukprot:195040-Hanusia_phi.AAC.1
MREMSKVRGMRASDVFRLTLVKMRNTDTQTMEEAGQEEEEEEEEESFIMSNWMNHADSSDEISCSHESDDDGAATKVKSPHLKDLKVKGQAPGSKMDITESVARILNQVQMERERTLQNCKNEEENDQDSATHLSDPSCSDGVLHFKKRLHRNDMVVKDNNENSIQTPYPPNPKRLSLLEKVPCLQSLHQIDTYLPQAASTSFEIAMERKQARRPHSAEDLESLEDEFQSLFHSDSSWSKRSQASQHGQHSRNVKTISIEVKGQPTFVGRKDSPKNKCPDEPSHNHGDFIVPTSLGIRNRSSKEPQLIATHDSSTGAHSCITTINTLGRPPILRLVHRDAVAEMNGVLIISSRTCSVSSDRTVQLAGIQEVIQAEFWQDGLNLTILDRGHPFKMPKYKECFDSALGSNNIHEQSDRKKSKVGQFYRGKYKTKSLVDLGRVETECCLSQPPDKCLGERFDDYSPYAAHLQGERKGGQPLVQEAKAGARKSFIDEVMKRGTAIVEKPKAPNWRSV